MTPFLNMVRSFSNKIISALSLAISTAVSTLIPTSDSLRAAASLIPSPIKPTVCPFSRSACTTLTFCRGLSLANTEISSTCFFNSSADSISSSSPSMMLRIGIPTSRHILRVTISLSPVSTFIAIPNSCKPFILGAAEGLAGSRKPIKPVSISLFSSSTA
ncbi:Uncharacterised protein [Sphingobacterium spiritivorum]|uniref:Uncharacterized protein n=1 Tax=Sphingobacterium spiritivorum TaxID=258 RepID=A0A380BGH0_SPHSI|nr:Uncharacterised protein [Sphingobacterium spiritivorum]